MSLSRSSSLRNRIAAQRLPRLVVSFSLFLFALWFVAWCGARMLIVNADLPHADVLVVLAGSAAYKERALHAAHMFHQGRAPLIVLTNDGLHGPWANEEQRNPLFVERAAQELRSAGVPADRVEVLPALVASTHDEAMLLREYAASHQIHSIMFVTSAYHSRRALATMRRTFAGTGIEIGLTSPALGRGMPSAATWWSSTDGWHAVGAEYLKLLYYAVRY